jgi:hypothetical protein
MAPYLASRFSRAMTVLCVNPDQLSQLDELIDHARRGGGRVAGFWFWELDRCPQRGSLGRALRRDLGRDVVRRGAVRAVSDRPVVVVPTPVEVRRARDYRRSEFGCRTTSSRFLFTFDYNSQPVRKNAARVVDAFRRASRPVVATSRSCIKSSNARASGEQHAALVARIGDDDRIVDVRPYLTRDAVWGLQSACDCYVSLHRSEGLGLGLAESMMQGKPAIATRWSGNLDFMTPENSALVDLRVRAGRRRRVPDVEPGAALGRARRGPRGRADAPHGRRSARGGSAGGARPARRPRAAFAPFEPRPGSAHVSRSRRAVTAAAPPDRSVVELRSIETRGICALRRSDLATIGTFAAPPNISQPTFQFRVDRYVLTSIGLAFARAAG